MHEPIVPDAPAHVLAFAAARSASPVRAHAVSRLRAARLARSTKPFLARGGPKGERCEGCRLLPSHCMCALRPVLATTAGFCLLMADIEALKPSNTGWLIADMVPDTAAFGWARTAVDPALLALLADPQWQPYVVFPGEYAEAARVVSELLADADAAPAPDPAPARPGTSGDGAPAPTRSAGPPERLSKRPLFVLLDATWPEARKMFRKSPYLNRLPVLSLQPEQLSRYRLRRSTRDDHFCTSEVAALCLELAGEPHAARTLEAYLDVYTHHYQQAKQQLPLLPGEAVHARLAALALPGQGWRAV